MTRKDYEAIAKAINNVRNDWGAPNGGLIPTEARHAMEEIEYALAKVFGQENPRFDKDKFFMACWHGN
jgi:hypothetical protein